MFVHSTTHDFPTLCQKLAALDSSDNIYFGLVPYFSQESTAL